mmetsp:Transcript_76822/g.221990  ORF Transcript_76822/g.221990 Transcript_76822/m.221990 type:complete len:254 (+) Transcript_76822:109-870(+)
MSAGNKYRQADLEEQKEKPPAWALFAPGAGQCEKQGYDDWTAEEKAMWEAGQLRVKWGIGQVSIRLPMQDPVTFVALVYGYLPFVIPIWWLLWALISKLVNGAPRFFPVFGLSIAIGFALVNELIIKQVCKKVLPASITSRPPEAVCKHPGMPSGHVMNAYTLMVWCFLEAALDTMVHFEWLVMIILVLGPVPWARVYNKDHTVPQVLASAVIATIMGCIAYYIRRTHFPNHEQMWDWYSANGGWRNPYAPKL